MGGGPSVEQIQQQVRATQRNPKQERKRFAEEKQLREADMAAGRERGEQLFGQGSLGTRQQTDISKDFADVIERRKQALQGLTPEERSAMESQALGGIQQATQTQLRQLRGIQGAQGVRGGLAAAQQAAALQQGQRAAAEAQRDIFLQNLAARRQAVGELEQTLGQEQQRAQQERFGQLSTEFGFAGLGAAERGGIRQQILGEKQAQLGVMQAAQNQGKK